uniref:Uncharacterized protein n=1 Tax=Chromera velia CCMP2878 TaxID=1169474 RepID=A0A0G4F7Q9_9ALVE|eukprot:Cvel_15665.t1-p1 / transcript=Cvel_15665.t1 / gene=Cvel_15665 / organism=Chromera_velia_CCMP2878 / gene_product=hypothetical protein / transcript_product=hypothetical protein / location=Cvel_scaffold1169:34350-36533(+) / protein_length=728 / sequence_SO=supercontig / SO=protein_coding / is_pseudo=false
MTALSLAEHSLFFAKIVPFFESELLHRLRVCRSWNEKVRKLVRRLSFYSNYGDSIWVETDSPVDGSDREDDDDRLILKFFPYLPAGGLDCFTKCWSGVRRLDLLVDVKPPDLLGKALGHLTRLSHLTVSLCATDLKMLCVLNPGTLSELCLRCPTGCWHQSATEAENEKVRSQAAKGAEEVFQRYGETLRKFRLDLCGLCDGVLPSFEGQNAHSTSLQIRSQCPLLEVVEPLACSCHHCRKMYRNYEQVGNSDPEQSPVVSVEDYLVGRNFDCVKLGRWGLRLSKTDWEAVKNPRLTGLRYLQVCGCLAQEEEGDFEEMDVDSEDVRAVFEQNRKIEFSCLQFSNEQLLGLLPFAQNLRFVSWLFGSFSEDVWREMGRWLVNLRVMSSSSCHDLSDIHMKAWAEGIRASGKPSKVRVIHHKGSRVTSEGLVAAVLPDNLCPELRSIEVGEHWSGRWSGGMSAEGIRAWAGSGLWSFAVNWQRPENSGGLLEGLKDFLRGPVRVSLRELSLWKIRGRVTDIDDELIELICGCPQLSVLSLGSVDGVSVAGWEILKRARVEKKIRLRSLWVGSDTRPADLDTVATPFFPPLCPPPQSLSEIIREENERRLAAEREEQRTQSVLDSAAEGVKNQIKANFRQTLVKAAAESAMPTGAVKPKVMQSPFKSIGGIPVRVGVLSFFGKALVDEIIQKAVDDLKVKERIVKERRVAWRQTVEKEGWETWKRLVDTF